MDINDVVQDTFNIPPQVNDELIISGGKNASIVVPISLSIFIVNVSMSNNGRQFLPIPSFGKNLIFVTLSLLYLC